MSKVIDAVYENGVFKPSQKVRLKNKQRVQIKILPDEDWQKRFDRVINSIRKKTSRFAPAEVQADVQKAIKEVRKNRRAC
jgi:predicted DNA-binding antitoxin AbrB/MazE fold protein